MKNRYKSIAFCIATMSLSFIACGPQNDLLPWEIIDESQNGGESGGGISGGDVSLEVMEGEMLSGLAYILNYDTHKYQYLRANSIDVFSGYFMVPHSVFEYGKPLLHTYDFPNGYYSGPLGESPRLYPYIYHAFFYGEKHGVPEWKALAEIAYAYSAQELTDFYGPIPYDDYRARKETPPLTYLSSKEVYERIFTDLDDAIAILNKAQPSAEQLKKVEGPNGGFSDGDWKNWVKFANSLRLRMALNMVKADPVKAQAIAESAVNDPIGVFKYGDKGFIMTMKDSPQHPHYQLGHDWNDIRLGASLENILKKYNSPLLKKWFTTNNGPIEANGVQTLGVGQDYAGIRQGTGVAPHNAPKGYKAFSTFTDKYMPRSY
ncbi:MAG: SusD/RagB family nutrient-binding outer membrane lipoprotein, partial [Bacteroidaceae bacterium]